MPRPHGNKNKKTLEKLRQFNEKVEEPADQARDTYIQTTDIQIDLNNPFKDLENNTPIDSKNIINELNDFKPRNLKPKPRNDKFIDLYDEIDSTPIYGEKRLSLLGQINRYIAEYPDILKNYKIDKNASEDELNEHIKQINIMIQENESNFNQFLTDGILIIFEQLEKKFEDTSFDFTNTSKMLRDDENFHKLMKRLYCKYSVFHYVNEETQLGMIVLSTMMINIHINKHKKKMTDKYSDILN